MNAIIVDDEHKAAKSLQNIIIKNFKEVNILDIVHDVEGAEILIRKLNPDLVFLDIVMPEESGFELLKKFKSIDFEIIFVTSHDEYALNAIKCCA
ncbi:MAG: response regulator, partial [Saprospiraceae bacterium]